jgi:hypothetical protein
MSCAPPSNTTSDEPNKVTIVSDATEGGNKNDLNAGSWTVEYHCGNSTDSVEYIKNLENYADAIEAALSCLIPNPSFYCKSKYGWPESEREFARAHLFRFGYVGDDSRCYHPRGLTRVEVYFEPLVSHYDNSRGQPLTETANEHKE